MSLSFITTTLNEEENISSLIDSVVTQSVVPNEVIIVDGGSSDKTVDIVKSKILHYRRKLRIKLFIKKGNRSVGRNEAIKRSSGDIILISDSGCVLDRNWVKNILTPFKTKQTDVVAGYYKALPRNVFQKSLVPYVFVMPDKLDEREFLPATRSMSLRKKVWERIGGFDEGLSHNEDYAFANKLRYEKFKIRFAKNAIVYWLPRQNILQLFKMFFRFSFGDIQAGLLRDKVVFIFLRYIYAFYLIALSVIMRSVLLWLLDVLLLFSYILWAIYKNYRYVEDRKAFFYLPLIQILSDFSVMSGTLAGFFEYILSGKLFSLIAKNKFVVFIILSYIFVMISVITWGIPNFNHPFTYHMDEWHFSQALRTFIKYGSGSVSGAASIPLFHIVSTILFLFPFYLFHIINPFLIKSSVGNIQVQHRFFEILRLHTLMYGMLSIVLIYIIIKKYVKHHPLIFTLFFSFSPIWIFLSNFYKYDITLNFWIIACIFFLFKFNESKNIYDYIYAGIACALSLSTKFTAAPLFIAYLLGYFIFADKKNYKFFFTSSFMVLVIFLTVGIMDMVLGKGNYYHLLKSTLIAGPKGDLNYILGQPGWVYLIFRQYPELFGYFLYGFFILSLIYVSYLSLKNFILYKIVKNKQVVFLVVTFTLFLISLIIFNIEGGGNRILVLLPFIIFICACFSLYISEKSAISGKFMTALLIAGLLFQFFQTYSWLSVKLGPDPRATSSIWIEKNIPPGSKIGIENIPIYQMLPDIVLKEFYSIQYGQRKKTRYEYSIVNAKTPVPRYVIVTDDFDRVNYLKQSSKKELVEKLNKLSYKRIITFRPDLSYYDLFSDKMTFLLVFPTPLTISVYEKI